MRRAVPTTTLGELVEELCGAAEEGAESAVEVHATAGRALVDTLVGAGRFDLVEKLQALAEDLELDDDTARTTRSTDARIAAA